MKRLLLLLAIFSFQLSTFTPLHAGGLMTNTNYHIAFDRMMARGASTDIDAAYSNPAGLVWGHEGWALSFNVQKPFQYRNIDATIDQAMPNGVPYSSVVGFGQHKFKGKASANPFVPALFASYRHAGWAVGLMAGIVGSGGKCKYEDGVPMFVVPVAGMMAKNGLMPGQYTLDAFMEGKQYIYGVQANFAYKFGNHWSASAGLRANIYNGYNRGHVVTTVATPAGSMDAVNLQIDVDQKGVGVNPFLSVNYRYKGLTVTGRYEFRSRLSIPNTTRALSYASMGSTTDIKAMADTYGNEATVAGMSAMVGEEMGQKVAAYLPGSKTRYDMPGLLSLAVGYEFVPQKLRGTVEYHWFDDKRAKMAGDRQKLLDHGTQEILVGLEWDVSKVVTLSAGGQRTDYGLTDEYQTNTSFACDSYSVGLGAAFNVTRQLRINAGYFCSIYSDYKRQATYSGVPVSETYSRTNHVFGLGIDYKF